MCFLFPESYSSSLLTSQPQLAPPQYGASAAFANSRTLQSGRTQEKTPKAEGLLRLSAHGWTEQMWQLRKKVCGAGVRGGWWQGQGGGYIFCHIHGEARKDRLPTATSRQRQEILWIQSAKSRENLQHSRIPSGSSWLCQTLIKPLSLTALGALWRWHF